ncbi:MAG: hypothetical protein KBT45_03440 [Bacteroidales bacterium]|nr:hypothetical protein [Candidatus Colimorpha pelethequi]
MKKVLSLIAAFVMFAGVAMADPINVVCTEGSARYYAEDNDLYIVLQNANYGFAFDIVCAAGQQDIVDGQTYTLADMLVDYSYGVDQAAQDYINYASASITRSADGAYVADVTDEDGVQYHITYTIVPPITEPTDTVMISMSNANYMNRAFDLVADMDVIQLIGYGDNNDYLLNVVFYATSFAGNYTLADRYEDDQYFMLYAVDADGNTTSIPCNNLLGATVTGSQASCTANIKWVAEDGTMYDITFAYADPVAQNHETFAANNLTITPNANYDLYQAYMGVNVYDFEASNDDYILYGTVYNQNTDDAFGTWDLANGDIEFNLYDAQTLTAATEPYTGVITITDGGNTITLTGTSLFYGNVEYTFNVTGQTVAIEDVEANNFFAYTEGRTVVLKGAQGRMVDFYDMTGRILSHQVAAEDNVRFTAPAAGVYMVRVDGKTTRVVVK